MASGPLRIYLYKERSLTGAEWVFGPRPVESWGWSGNHRRPLADHQERDLGGAEEAEPRRLAAFASHAAAHVDAVPPEDVQPPRGDGAGDLAQGHRGAEPGDDHLASVGVARDRQVDPRPRPQAQDDVGPVGDEDADVPIAGRLVEPLDRLAGGPAGVGQLHADDGQATVADAHPDDPVDERLDPGPLDHPTDPVRT